MITKYFITGSTGMLGRALIKELKKNKKNIIFESNTKKNNLLNFRKLNNFFLKNKPNVIIHLASVVYGVGGNHSNKFHMINENILMNSNLFKLASKNKIKKIVCVGSSAGYSNNYLKMKESNFLKFMPDQAEIYYGWAKRTMLMQLKAMNEQFGIKYNYIIMNNLYGKHDNYNIVNGHVIPSLIHKFYLSIKFNKLVEVWKPKDAKRSFLYVDDAVDGIIKIMNSNEKIVNLGGRSYFTIYQVVEKISKIYNYKKEIRWINNKFKATKERFLDYKKVAKMGFEEKTSLENGLKKTITWFIQNYNKKKIKK